MRRIGRWIKGILVVVVLGAFYGVVLFLPGLEINVATGGGPPNLKPVFGIVFGEYAEPARLAWRLFLAVTIGYIAHMLAGGGTLIGAAVGAVPMVLLLVLGTPASRPPPPLAPTAALVAIIPLPCAIGGALAKWRRRDRKG